MFTGEPNLTPSKLLNARVQPLSFPWLIELDPALKVSGPWIHH